jgi:hypothetical protein
MRTAVSFTSQVFDKAVRQQKLTSMISRSSRDFRESTKTQMVEGLHTGRVYRRKSGAGFRRSHIASAVGQRPSPDTLTLVNAVTQEMTGPDSAQVFIAEKINPLNGAVASNYAEILQEKLDRPIMDERDAIAAQQAMDQRAEQLAVELGA